MDMIIVDDEALACDRLVRLATELGYEVTGTAGSVAAGLSLVERYDPSIILLDIEMPGGTGIELAEEVAKMERPPAIIFTTAYEQYALEAFSTIAAGYLLKPIKREQLQQALERAQTINKVQLENLGQQAPLSSASEAGNKAKAHEASAVRGVSAKHITVNSHRGMDLIPIDSIRYFLADSKYISVVTTDHEFVMDGTLKQLEAEFSSSFLRVHRNAMVSVAHIQGLDRTTEGHYCVRLKDIEQRPVVSRRYASKVKLALEPL